MLTRAQFTALAEAAERDPQALIERVFRIQTKNQPGQLPVDYLRLNVPQRKIHEALLRQRQAGRPPRLIILKARQPGASTLAAAYVAATMLSRPYAHSMIVAHTEDAARGLFQKVRFMVDQLPEELRPFVKTDRRGELVLRGMPCLDGEVQLETACYVGSATGEELWRGKTIQTLHLSELAQYPRAEETLLGAMQAVPLTPQSLVIIESTARGMGNTFQEEWVRAEAGHSDFVPVFIPWWELPDCYMAVPRDLQLDPEERALKKAFGLSPEQLQWRRYILHTSCQGDKDLFSQEFPSTASEAFLATGRPAFPIPVLREMYDRAQKLTPLRATAGTFPAQGLIGEDGAFHRLARGPFTIYRPPEENHEYVVGIDVAAGVEGGDYSCAQVFDRQREEQVAVWHSHLTPIAFARACIGIGRLYNTAWVAPELSGGWGYSVVEEFKSVQYPRLYIWVRIDKVRNTSTNYYGWDTSPRTRPLLVNGFANALIEKSILLVDPETILECMEFQYIDGRRAEGRKHDDRVFGIMIAYRVHL